MQKVATALDLKSWQAVQQWEHSRAAPSRENLGKLANLYGVSMEYLLHGSAVRTPPLLSIGPSRDAMRVASAYDSLPPTRQRLVLDLLDNFDALLPADTAPAPLKTN